MNEKIEIITPRKRIFNFSLLELNEYRDLLFLLLKKDFSIQYKQTILGPLWGIFQTISMSLVFTFIFSVVAKISTDNIHPLLFYLLGSTAWGYFQYSTNIISRTFQTNAHLFEKVYFPRILIPLSVILSCLVRYFIQFSVFLIFYFYLMNELPNNILFIILKTLFPLLLLSACSLGIGLIIASLSFKYKDLLYLSTFLIQLGMYATPVIYPLSAVPESLKIYSLLNPLTPVFEYFRFLLFAQSSFNSTGLIYSISACSLLLLIGVLSFSHTEQDSIDYI